MKNMSVIFKEANRIEVGEVDSDFLPLGDHEVLVRTHVSLISAGTELACLSGVEAWFRFPAVPGYASIGEVVEVGSSVSGVVPGDMVYSMGGHCQYQVIDAANPRALPPVLPLVGRYGEVILLGTPRGAYETNLTAVLSHVHLDGLGNVTFKGAHEWRYPVPRDPFVKHSILRNAELALDLIRSGDLQVAPLHTHTLKPEQAQEAYDGLKNKKDKYIGVVFDWTGV